MEALVLYQYRGNNEDAVRGDKMRLMMTMTMQSLSMMYHIILLCYIQCTNQRRVVDRHYGCWVLMYRVVGSTVRCSGCGAASLSRNRSTGSERSVDWVMGE
jgi:hypothetical protein